MVSITTALPNTGRIDDEDIGRWIAAQAGRYTPADRDSLTRACELARDTYGEQQLAFGEGRLRAALHCADILACMKMDADTLAAAILNGVPEAAKLSTKDVSKRFGPVVAHMVDDLGRIDKLSGLNASPDTSEQHSENLRRLLLGMAKDVRVILVVLAERLHLMRAIKSLPDEARRQSIASETQGIYAPLANRLGIWQIKWELEDLCLRYLRPDEYKELAKQLDGRRQDREDFIRRVMELLDGHFRAVGINAEITGRPKHIFSIWKKMQRKAVGIDQIFDIRAVRVLVDDVAQCYAALGIVHGLWRHIPGEFDDYIATPKSNMYQSLHTAVIGPDDKPLEIQIRTHDMHHHSELGVAAHWRYKEDSRHDSDFEKRVVWMRQWLEQKDEAGSEDEGALPDFSEIEPEQVYVLTPQGKVVELPKGSTPLDFAYSIHTDIGHRCRGAKVNGRITPLTQALTSGDTVEILTQKNAQPSRDWLSPHLGYLHTSKARNRIRQWFKQQDFDQHLAGGRTTLEREIQRLGLTGKPDLAAVATKYNLKRDEDVLAAIGRGELSAIQVAGTMGRPAPAPTPASTKPRGAAQRHGHKPVRGRGEVIVEGVDDLMTHMARCCKPVPYDPIVGFITRGAG